MRDLPVIVLGSDHCVGVQVALHNGLANLPMLDELAFRQPEEVYDGQPGFLRLAPGVHMHDDEIPIRENPLDLALHQRKGLPELL